jgi:ADP-heptose:LPS heptosyltransferase
VLRALGLGDLLTGVPALRAVRRAYADHEIVLAAPRELRPLVELAGVADVLLDTRGLDALGWPWPPPELAVNLHGRGPESHRLLASCRPGRLVAFGCPPHEGPPWRAEEHEVRRWCRLVEEGLGIPADPEDLSLAEPAVPAPVPDAVVVHPGAAYPSRRWPASRFAAVARWAAERGHRVVVTGGPTEVDLAETVRRGAGLAPDAVLAGRTSLDDLAAVVASACLVVAGDTGVAHLATAYRTPSVLLFGPTSPDRWGPPAGGRHTVIWHGDDSGDPRASELDPALARITIDEVITEVDRQITLILARSARTTPRSA